MKTTLITGLLAIAAMGGVTASPMPNSTRDETLDLLVRSGAHPRMIKELMGRVHAKRQDDGLSATNPIASDAAASDSAAAEEVSPSASVVMNGTLPSDPVPASALGSPTPTSFKSGFNSATPRTTMDYAASSASAALAALKSGMPDSCNGECANWIKTNEDCTNLLAQTTPVTTIPGLNLTVTSSNSDAACIPLLCDSDNFNGMVQCFNCLAPVVTVPAELDMSPGKAYGVIVDAIKQGCGKTGQGQPKQTVKYTGSAMRSNSAVSVVATAGAAVAGAVLVMI